MTSKEKITLERIDQKLDDLKESFLAVAGKVDCHEKEINKAKGWAAAISTGIALIGVLFRKYL